MNNPLILPLTNIIHQQDILEEMLSRLPAKSIGRFRCVSKPWKALLSQPHFIKSHLNQTKHLSPDDQSLILVAPETKSLFTANLKNAHHMFDEMTAFATNITFGVDPYYVKVMVDGQMCSCDGLTLIEDYIKQVMLLVNLTTKEFKLLPELPYAFDPFKWCFLVFGIGYDSGSDDYKVVVFSEYCGDIKKHGLDSSDKFVCIYSVKKGTWKKSDDFLRNYHFISLYPGVFFHGHIHWVAKTNPEKLYDIVAFDTGKETFRQLEPPKLVKDNDVVLSCSSYVFSLKGCLCYFVKRMSSKTDVWMMREYGDSKSWMKIMILEPEKVGCSRPLCLLTKEELVLKNMEDERRKKDLILYNIKEGRSKDIVVQGTPQNILVRETFMESLVSPHCNVEAIIEE